MKHTINLLVLLFISTNIFAQNPITEDISEDISNTPIVIDTVSTSDKFTKILIYDNHTWEYLDLGRPIIDSTDFFEYWDTDIIHSYKEIPLSEIPDEVDLRLVDSNHHYCPPITGRVRSGYTFRRTREHKGIDIPLTIGDTIRAAFDGVIRVAEFSRNTGGYGNLIVIRHPNGLETYYGHLSKYIVDTSEVVKAGEVIGYGGNTGRSTGPHLHFETRYMGQAFDPERLIDFETGALRDTIVTIHKHYFSIYSHYGQTDEESKASSERVVHKIRSGDTLGSLAVKYHTTISKICKLNGIKSTKVLRIGQRLIVR